MTISTVGHAGHAAAAASPPEESVRVVVPGADRDTEFAAFMATAMSHTTSRLSLYLFV